MLSTPSDLARLEAIREADQAFLRIVVKVVPADSRLTLSTAEVPRFVWNHWDEFTVQDRRRALTFAWRLSLEPSAHLPMARWLELFRSVAYFSDTDQPRPTVPMTLFRGSMWSKRRGLAWTLDLDRARWFTTPAQWSSDPDWRSRFTEPAHVFRVDVPPEAILARLGRPGDPLDEDEVVVDPAKLPPIGRDAIVT